MSDPFAPSFSEPEGVGAGGMMLSDERKKELGKKVEAIEPFVRTGHGRIVYACGHVYAQCRCPENHNVTSTLPNACPSCAGPPKVQNMPCEMVRIPLPPPSATDDLITRIQEIERDAAFGREVRNMIEWANRHRSLMGINADLQAMDEIRALVEIEKEQSRGR